nr:ribonuclease H-like domain-containing protein [Tanacetum cinerariifolium]
PQKVQEDQGYADSGCSRHMTGNMSYLSDFKEFDEGYVTFRGGANGGRITGKGTHKTGKLAFEDVYFVKELKFNLLSVSQMRNKKNNVLFIDTGCFVLSLDFKLADESQGHPQKVQEDQGYADSGCSRHMTGNMSYLSDFKEFDEGYVTFRGGANGGRITGKGTHKTGKLAFEDVYFVKELKFNLLSVSQMRNKKNNVLFIDTGCFVLSLDFKLADESQVLLKFPRENNMYSVDMKNIVLKESLTCLVAKANWDMYFIPLIKGKPWVR